MMKFTVIDKQTGKYPHLQEIARKEDWANNLVSCYMSGFLIDEDGWLYLADDYGNIACCPQDRFEVIYQDDFETPKWTKAADKLPESDGFYLAWYTFKDGRHVRDIFYYNCGSPMSSAITHWMPLPQPPEIETEKAYEE